MAAATPQLIYPSFAENYIRLAGSTCPKEAQQLHGTALIQFYSALPAARAHERYAPEKWSMQEVMQHIIDTERIFVYRLLCILRNEKNTLLPFDENAFALAAKTDAVSWEQTMAEWQSSREATSIMLQGIPETGWDKIGQVGDYRISARAIGLLLTGHQLHHRHILIARYGC
ncbi:MAG: DinB family protein [Bacteroidota bacterium]|jgi:uncharacterized damage-inducible protein DinB